MATSALSVDNDAAFENAQRQADPTQNGRWAVLHDGRLHGIFDTLAQASWYASEHFETARVAIRQLRVDRR